MVDCYWPALNITRFFFFIFLLFHEVLVLNQRKNSFFSKWIWGFPPPPLSCPTTKKTFFYVCLSLKRRICMLNFSTLFCLYLHIITFSTSFFYIHLSNNKRSKVQRLSVFCTDIHRLLINCITRLTAAFVSLWKKC